MATKRQIAANRRNALKSTGPKTEKGKNVSSKNAVRHGVFSHTPVTEYETEEIFNKFMRPLIIEYQPRDDLEIFDLKEIAGLMVRRERLSRFEAIQLSKQQTITMGEVYKTEAGKDAEIDDISDAHKELALGLAPMLSIEESEKIERLHGRLSNQIERRRRDFERRRETKIKIINDDLGFAD